MGKIIDAEVHDLGRYHSQYFQGYGTAFTKFTDSVTGIGDTFGEALEDALEGASQMLSSEDYAALIEVLSTEVGKPFKEWALQPKHLTDSVMDDLRAEFFATYDGDPEYADEAFDEYLGDGINVFHYAGIRWQMISAV